MKRKLALLLCFSVLMTAYTGLFHTDAVQENLLLSPLQIDETLWLNPGTDISVSQNEITISATGIVTLQTTSELTDPVVFEGEYTYNTLCPVSIPILVGQNDIYPHLSIKNGTDGRIYFGAQNSNRWYFTGSEPSGITFSVGKTIGFKAELSGGRLKYSVVDRTVNPTAAFGTPLFDYALSDLANDLRDGSTPIGIGVISGWKPAAGFYVEGGGSITGKGLSVYPITSIPTTPSGPKNPANPAVYTKNILNGLTVDRTLWINPQQGIGISQNSLTISRTGIVTLKTAQEIPRPFLFEGNVTIERASTFNIPVLAAAGDLSPHLAVKHGTDGRIYFGAQNENRWYFTGSVDSEISFAVGKTIGFRVILDKQRLYYYLTDRTTDPDAPFGASLFNYALSDLGGDLKDATGSLGSGVFDIWQPVAGFYMENDGQITATGLQVRVIEYEDGIDSDEYLIEDGFIKSVPPGTPIETLMEALIPHGGTLKATEPDGTEKTNWQLYAGTGMRVQLISGSAVKQENPLIVYGDVTGDGAIGVRDLIVLKKQFAGTVSLSGAFALSADADWSGDIGAGDMVSIRKHILGIKPVEWDINALPSAINGIKWGTRFESGDTPRARMKFWKDQGINTVFVLVHDLDGKTLLPPTDSEAAFGHVYDSTGVKSDDVLRDLVQAAKDFQMTLFAGNWMFRDEPMAQLHPQWLQRDPNGASSNPTFGSSDLLSPASPYMEEEVYPFYRRIVEEYGIRNIFLQEMWYNQIDYSDYNMDAFLFFKYGENLPEARESLIQNIKTQPALQSEAVQFQYRLLKQVVATFEEITGPDGTVLWHESGIQGLMQGDPDFCDNHWLGTMSLYPDEAIFAGRENYTTEMDPFLSFTTLTSYHSRLGATDKRLLEYYAFYEMARIERPILRQDIESLHFAARAAGFSNFCMEADAHFHYADMQNFEVWNALRDVNTVIAGHFTDAVYKGLLTGAQITGQSGAGGYGSWWQKADGTKIILLGNQVDYLPLSATLVGRDAIDPYGAPVPLTITVQPGVMKMFIVTP